MSEYKKLHIHQFPKAPGRVTDEAAYWARLRSPVLIKEFSSINSIHFSPVSPYDFCTASSARVQVYSSASQAVKKTISRFKDVVHSSAIRQDGKLLVAGDASGLVQLFDLGSRAILRTMRGHNGAVHAVNFFPTKTNILSGSDDKTAVVWDVPSETPMRTFDAHEDYVRAAITSPDTDTFVATGSYDHTVRIWDTRSEAVAMSMSHGDPVEALLMLPGGSLLASAGGNRIKIWDILSGGRLITTIQCHQKTVTSLACDGTGSYMLSGSLDQHVKIISVEGYRVVHAMRYPAPILSLDISPNNSHLAVGMTSGLLSIRHRTSKTSEIANRRAADAVIRGGTYQYFMRGSSYEPDETDTRVEIKRRARLQPYDKLLRGFQYAAALDAVLEGTRHPLVILSMLEELVHRDGLRVALAGRDERTLQPVLWYIFKHISNPRYASILVDVSHIILDIYASVLTQSEDIVNMMHKLKRRVREEIQIQQEYSEMMGLVENLMSMSSRE